MVGHKTQGGNGVGLCIVGEAQLYTIYKLIVNNLTKLVLGWRVFRGKKLGVLVKTGAEIAVMFMFISVL